MGLELNLLFITTKSPYNYPTSTVMYLYFYTLVAFNLLSKVLNVLSHSLIHLYHCI